MSNELVTISDERIAVLLHHVKRLSRSMAEIKRRAGKPSFRNEVFVTDRELSERLRISRRTLQVYRESGRLPYYQLDGKILYAESDVQRVLDSFYRRGFDLE